MPPRRRRSETGPRRWHRRWPLHLLFGLAVLCGVVLWAYGPSLPPEVLIARYANSRGIL